MPRPMVPSGFSVSPVLTGIEDDHCNPPTITYDPRTGSFRFADPNAVLLNPSGTLNGSPLLGTRLFGGAGPSASDYLGGTLPFAPIERRPEPTIAPSSALSIRIDGSGRITVVDDYRTTVEAGRNALARLTAIRQMTTDGSSTDAQIATAMAEVPALLATYRAAAERVREVHTKSGMNPYATIDAWSNLAFRNNSSSLEGVMVGFNMQGLNSRDASYRSGTAVKELVAHFGPVVAQEMGLTGVERLGTWGTNSVFSNIPADRAQDFMNRLRTRVTEFLNGSHPFPTSEMATRIGCERTDQLRIRNWTPEILGMVGGHANTTLTAAEAGRSAVVTQRIIETLTLMADRARYAETHPTEATGGLFSGTVPDADRGRGAEPLLIATNAANQSGEGNPTFTMDALVRGGIVDADIAAGLLPRPGHDAGYSIAHARALDGFFQSMRGPDGNIPPETFRARAAELRAIIDSPQLYLFANSVRNSQGQLSAEAISRAAATPEGATRLTALLRAAQNPDGTWNWARVTESRAEILATMSTRSAQVNGASAADTLNHIYDLSLRDYRFPDFYRTEAFPHAVERFLNGGEGFVQMIDLKNFYSMKLELGDRYDTAMRTIADQIRNAYAERGIDVIIAKRGDEFYVCMRNRTRTGEIVNADMINNLNRSLTESIGETFRGTVLPQMGKYPGDMAGIHADNIPFSVENLARTDANGQPIDEPGIVVRERPANQIEYVIHGNEVYVTRQPGDMNAFAQTVMAASEAGLGRAIDPRNGNLHVVGSFKEVPDTRGQRRTQTFVRLQVNAETGETHPVMIMMPGGDAPHATDVLRGGTDVGATISGAVPVNETHPGDPSLIDIALGNVGDSTSSQKSPLGPDLLPVDPVRPDLIPWEAGLSPRGRFAAGAMSFGIPGLGMRVVHGGFGVLTQGSTYTGLSRDFLAMSAGSALAEPAGVRVAALLRMGGRAQLFGHGFGLVGGTLAMTFISSNGRATFRDYSVAVGSASAGLLLAAGIMRGVRTIAAFSNLAGPARMLIRATIETIAIELISMGVTAGLNYRDRAQLRSNYVAAFRNFDQAVHDAQAAGPNAPDRAARLELVRTRSRELGQAFNRYLPVLQMNGSSEGRAYMEAYMAHDSAVAHAHEMGTARMFGGGGDSFVVHDPVREQQAIVDTQAAMDRADRAMRDAFERDVTRVSSNPPPFLPFGTVRDASTYDGNISNNPAGLFVQHSNNVMLRLQALGISGTDMPTYTAALMGR